MGQVSVVWGSHSGGADGGQDNAQVRKSEDGTVCGNKGDSLVSLAGRASQVRDRDKKLRKESI